MRVPRFIVIAACFAALAAPASAHAQDPFAIEVYGPRTTALGEWELETHLNYVARGTRTFDGAVAPTDRQVHLSLELGGGLARFADVAGYLLLARRPGASPEYAGWRLRARIGGPASSPLPVALVAEVGQALAPFGEGGTTLELTPVVGRRWGRWEVVANASVERGFGSATEESEWELEPSGRVAFTASRLLDLEIEYHGVLGSFEALLASGEQRHQLYPGATLRLGEFAWNVGVGIGLTSEGDRVRLKTRLEIPLLEPRSAH